MKLSQILTEDQVLLHFAAEDKWQAIEELVTALVRTGRLPQELEAASREALLVRERSMTTGMENGIAIPHAALDELPELLGVLAIVPDGIDFDTIDGQPGRILVGLLIPRQVKLLHIRTLAGIARLMSDSSVRQQILESPTATAVLAAIRGAE